MSAKTGLLNERAGWMYYGTAVTYAIGAYALGIAGLFHSALLLNAAATLLLAHAMTISAYLIHECGHNMIFRRHRNNAMLGRVMSWLCGAAYGTYEDMRYKHFRHHVDNDDVVWFAFDTFFERHPIATSIIRVLEWFYIPAHDLIMHGIMVFTSFVIPQRRDQRIRNVAVIMVRGGIFVTVAILFPRAALLYVVAYLIMMHILRFMDSVQHERFPRLNWLVLNFGYHNAHHADMNLPFYRLPALHAEISGNDAASVIPFWSQLKLYHHNRVSRVYNPQPEGYPQGRDYLRTAQSGSGPIGGNAASFLTSF